MNMPIRRKISLWYTFMIILLLVFLIPNIYFSVSTAFSNKETSDIYNDWEVAASHVEYDNGKLEYDDISPFITLALYDTNEKLVFTNISSNMNISPPPDFYKIQTLHYADDTWYLYDAPVRVEGSVAGHLLTITKSSFSINTLQNLLMVLLISVPIFITVTIILGRLIIKRAFSPITNVIVAAKEIGMGDLTKRIEQSNTKDEIGDLTNTFNDMLNKLSDAFEREIQFSNNASHELRTPISIIMSHSEDALNGVKTQSEYIETLSTVHEQSKHIKSILEKLLNSARKKEIIEIEKVNLSEMVLGICEEISFLHTDIDFALQIEKNIYIDTDQTLLTRAIMNLIDNAVKYNVPNGFVKVSLKKAQKKVLLFVEDGGIGISKDDLPYIFQKFFRGEKSHTGKGSGLGLSMVKNIASSLNIELKVKSTLSKGSRFTLIFVVV